MNDYYIDPLLWYNTRDGQKILGKNVFELDSDGFVVSSLKYEIIDLNKHNNDTIE